MSVDFEVLDPVAPAESYADMLNDDMPTDVKGAAHWWLEFGFNVIPLNPETKQTAVKWEPWLDKLSHESIESHWSKYPNHELAAVMDDSFFVLDADSEKQKAILAQLEKAHGVTPNLIAKTNKGEHHFFKRDPAKTYAKMASYSTEKEPNALDIRTGRGSDEGRSIIALAPSTGKSIVINEAANSGDLTEVDQAFIDAVFIHNGKNAPRPVDRSAIVEYERTGNAERCAKILFYIDPSLGNGDWFKVGAGLHDEFQGSEIGFAIFNEWSAEGENYGGVEQTEYRWNMYTAGFGITFASVVDMAIKAGCNIADYPIVEDPPRSYDDVLADAKELSEDSSPSDIQAITLESARLTAIERRLVWSAIKKNTGTTFTVLEQAVREQNQGEAQDHLSHAKSVIKKIGKDNILATASHVWQWDNTGVWRECEERTVRSWSQDTLADEEEVSKGLLDSVTDLLKTEIFVPRHRFDVGDDECVNTLNGEVALIGGRWESRPHLRENYRTTQIPVRYDPYATAPRFLQFLGEIFPSEHGEQEAQALLELMGYSLMTHSRHEKFVILVGEGANGKSVVLKLLESLCGNESVAGVQPSQFANTFQRAHLLNKLVNIVSEIEQGAVIDDAALKGITSGETTTVEQKFKPPFQMTPFSTCWFGTNHMPHTRDFSDGTFRRAVILKFVAVFKPELGNCDPMLLDKLKLELSGILTMALNAYGKALVNGFTTPESSKQAVTEWRLEADQVAQFISDECSVADAVEISPTELYGAYKSWALDNGVHRSLSMKSFRDRLTRLGFGTRRTRTARMVTGIQLQNSFNQLDDI